MRVGYRSVIKAVTNLSLPEPTYGTAAKGNQTVFWIDLRLMGLYAQEWNSLYVIKPTIDVEGFASPTRLTFTVLTWA